MFEYFSHSLKISDHLSDFQISLISSSSLSPKVAADLRVLFLPTYAFWSAIAAIVAIFLAPNRLLTSASRPSTACKLSIGTRKFKILSWTTYLILRFFEALLSMSFLALRACSAIFFFFYKYFSVRPRSAPPRNLRSVASSWPPVPSSPSEPSCSPDAYRKSLRRTW